MIKLKYTKNATNQNFYLSIFQLKKILRNNTLRFACVITYIGQINLIIIGWFIRETHLHNYPENTFTNIYLFAKTSEERQN